MQDQSRSHFERLLKPILASRFLTISALVHLLIIVLLGGTVLFKKYVELPHDFDAGPDIVASLTPPVPPPLPSQPTLPAPPPPPQANSLIPLFVPGNPGPFTFTMPHPYIAPPGISKDLAPPSPGTGVEPALPGPMTDRDVPGQAKAADLYHAGPKAGPTVLRALRWLQAQQHRDGTWGGDRGAFTGLSLLCFLGHGETPRASHEFGVVVSNAINALVAEGNRNEGRFSFGKDFDGNSAAYEHGICTYALCEAYTMTRDERLAPLIEEAVDYIVKGQRPDGGWAYSFSMAPDVGGNINSDTSVSGWQIQALKAAHLTGIPGIEAKVRPALDLAMRNMDRVFNPKDGSFGYRKAGDKNYSLTGVGVLSKLFWLGRPDRTVRLGIKNIETRELKYKGADCNLYTWYYDTQACFQAQQGAWDWWNARFQDQLTSTQSGDGSWGPTGGKEAGGYEAGVTGDAPIYRTTLCTLMLEVFYRYAPTSEDTALSGGRAEGL